MTEGRGFFDFTGKVAFVGGAGNVGEGIGNGKAISILLARRGAAVFAVDIVPEAAQATVAMIRAEGGRAEAHVADATTSDSVAAAMAACAERFGGIDIVVNNVGGSAPGGAVEMSEDVWDAQIAFNLTSTMLGCKHSIPHLLARGGGVIVNMASIAALRMNAARPHIAYSAAKHGVIALSRSVAVQYAARGIRCNTVIPGLINTPLVAERLTRQLGVADVADLIARRDAQVPQGRMGTCWDVANAALYLAADEAAHVTGTELLVDGGIAAAMA